MNFNFGNKPLAAAAPAVSAAPAFGAVSPQAAPAPASSFTFGAANAANKPATGIFGADSTKPGGFSFMSPTAAAPSIFGSSPAAPNFSLGSPQTTQTTMFGGITSPVSAVQSPSTFGLGVQPTQSTMGFSGFGAAVPPNVTPAVTSPTMGLNFGAKPANAPAWPTFGGTPPAVSSAGFGAPQPTALTSPQTSMGTTFQPGVGNTLQQSPGNLLSSGFSFAQPTTTSTSAPGFNFGQTATSTPGVGLGLNVAKPTLGFGLPSSEAAPSIPGLNPPTTAPALNFGGVTAPASSAFSFGGAPNTGIVAPVNTSLAAPATTSFGFGAPNVSVAPMFGKPTTSATGFNFGTPPQSQALPATQTSGFSFTGAPTTTSAFAPAQVPTSSTLPSVPTSLPKPAQIGVSFPHTNPQTKPVEFSFGGPSAAPVTTAPASTAALPTSGFTGFQLPTQQTPVASLGTVTIVSNTPTNNTQPKTLTSGITLGISPVSSAATTPGALPTPVGVLPTTTSSVPISITGFQLPVTSAVSTAVSTIGALTAPATTTTTASGVSVQPTPVTSMNFGQLEDAINKWSLELEDQEKVFINQATQVNAWDRLLTENGEKIVGLNEALQNVRREQQSLDHELDFVLGQQRELEDLLVPLEKDLSNVVINDPEREQTYRLTDTIDTQLKQMSEDLKEIIEHLNESNRREDNNDPIVQIGRILNAHMSSMQWIDSSIAQISNKLDQLSNMHNMLKRHNKRSFNLTYK